MIDLRFSEFRSLFSIISVSANLGKDLSPFTLESHSSFLKSTNFPEESIKATDVGIMVSDYLTANFPKIVDVSFTSNMESNLDKIADGTKDYKETLSDFNTTLTDQIQIAFFNPSGLEAKSRKAFPLRIGHFFTDISKIQQDLSWQPSFDLKTGGILLPVKSPTPQAAKPITIKTRNILNKKD